MIFDLLQDPKEETDAGLPANWVRTPIRYMMQEFQQSLKKHPPIPPGAPDDYRPK
jgi:arylsulfatase